MVSSLKELAGSLFDSWNILKKKTHQNMKTIGIKERDVLFIRMGQNIGYEQDGKKGGEFLRPVVVVKKFNKDMFLGIALTTKIKNDRYHFPFTFYNKSNKKIENCAILSQVRFYDAKRVKYKSGMIQKDDFVMLYKQFLKVIKPESVTPSKEGEPRRDSTVNILTQEGKYGK
ncbi:type II toxin-antitoxin system PemK/MazF family toxin [Sulfurimonas sp.]